MTTVETSQEPYDPTRTYTGRCNLDYFYWTTNSGIPNCGSQYRFRKTAFVCEQGAHADSGRSGSYTDTMSMYRKSGNKWKWRTINRNLTNNAVECRADEGIHGYGADPASRRAVRRARVRTTRRTRTIRIQGVDWGSSPTHRVYTVYDSNYLNWYHNPPGSSMSRTDIVKAVTTNVLGSINNVNVGFMRFNWSQGGPVIHALKDLDSNRAEAHAGRTGTFRQTAGRRCRRRCTRRRFTTAACRRHYGALADTDPDAVVAFTGTGEFVYDQPADYACAKNFIVLLTDGEPTQDTDAYWRVPTLPGYPSVVGRSDL